MPKIAYVPRDFNLSSQAVIVRANQIITEYVAQGFTLTLRQLYYQFVARGFLANKQTEYKRLGSIVNDGRLAGLIDWTAIEDRTRWLRDNDDDHGDPDTWLGRIVDAFHKARWDDQPSAPEVWIEKDALVGVVEAACAPLRVPYFACRGYASQSEVWEAAQRMIRYRRAGRDPVIFHLGDHDPSGIDMTRDITDRLALFCESHGVEAPQIKRLALNMPQVEEWNPPPNPAKMSDSRFEGYEREFGDESWELDALDPATLRDLISTNVEALIDRERWDAMEAAETEAQDRLRMVSDRWDEVMEFLA
jgi:hypothetical protein